MDQLRLWEQETMRIIPYDAYVYDNFDSSELYQRTLAYAQQLGAVLWESSDAEVQAFACDRRGGDGGHVGGSQTGRGWGGGGGWSVEDWDGVDQEPVTPTGMRLCPLPLHNM
jgi:hypothetical protein